MGQYWKFLDIDSREHHTEGLNLKYPLRLHDPTLISLLKLAKWDPITLGSNEIAASKLSGDSQSLVGLP
ncbi:hypothetical protein PG996_002982 [Apiospora saccharicola]|uniref:Uncharacterized protein n=1 Tax=Apiospora saccharicola TaxID=335842 RepID=A0ABR1W026_9PEZI